MKTFLKIAAASIIFAFATTSAYAQDMKPYVGIGLGTFTTDFGSGFKSAAAFGGFLQGGVAFNQYIAAELRIGSVGSSKVSNTLTAKSKIGILTSYLLKPQFPITEQASIYGLLGATTTKVTVSSAVGGPASATKTQVSFGAGLEYKVQNAVSIGAEYVQYSNKASGTGTGTDTKVTGISANLNYHF